MRPGTHAAQAVLLALLAACGGGGGSVPAAPLPSAVPSAASPATPTGAPAAGPLFTPGAAGAGDPYFPLDGNGGYDVTHYDLDLDYAGTSGRLDGVATLAAVATQNLSRFHLDLVGLTVREVSVNAAPARFRRTAHELVVTPAAGLPAGIPFTVVVRYAGVPEPVRKYTPFGAGSGFLRTPDGFVVAGQPHVAATWFPVNDHPSDRAAYTFRVTVPQGRTAVANGVLAGRRAAGGRTTWTWRAVEPMAPYLATVVAGRFALSAYTRNGIRYWDAVDTTLKGRPAANAAAAFARQGEIMDFLVGLFGPYPFRAAGSIVHGLGLGFALENQTRSQYPVRLFADRRHGISLMVHEAAHQWFGDSLTLARWRHMWLNEGIATYAQWLWAEQEGYGTVEGLFRAAYARRPGDSFWTVPISNPGKDRIFSAAVYERGAMTVHQLRRTVGDEAFFAILRAWPTERRGKTVTTAQFVALAERVSGKDLRSFFDRWLRTRSKPAV